MGWSVKEEKMPYLDNWRLSTPMREPPSVLGREADNPRQGEEDRSFYCRIDDVKGGRGRVHAGQRTQSALERQLKTMKVFLKIKKASVITKGGSKRKECQWERNRYRGRMESSAKKRIIDGGDRKN